MDTRCAFNPPHFTTGVYMNELKVLLETSKISGRPETNIIKPLTLIAILTLLAVQQPLPAARPRSDRFRCGGHESKCLQS